MIERNFNIKEFITDEIRSSLEVKQKLFNDVGVMQSIADVSEAVIYAYRQKKKVLLAGNGGSAGDAQHIAGELVSRFYFDRPALSALSLSTDPSVVTAIGNDYGYEKLFVRQIEAHGQAGDIFIGISTSGRSPNILKALARAKEMGLITVALTSMKGQEMTGKICHHVISVPSESTPKIQECHITIGHAICAAVEKTLFFK